MKIYTLCTWTQTFIQLNYSKTERNGLVFWIIGRFFLSIFLSLFCLLSSSS